MATNAGDGKGSARKGVSRRTPVPKTPPSTREKIARPLREAASRARRLLKRLANLRGAASRKLREFYRHETHGGDLEALQAIVEALEGHAAAFDMPVDFSPLRRRLEGLLSVLIEVSDDRLAAVAAKPLAEEVAVVLHRAEAIFLLPDALYRALDHGRSDLAAVRDAAAAESYDLARDTLLEHVRAKSPPEALESWLLECPDRCLTEAELVTHGFCRDRARRGGGGRGRVWRFVGTPFRWEDVHFALPHGHAETATLAKAYVASGNEAFAAEAVSRILGWAAAVAPPSAEGAGLQHSDDARVFGAWDPERAAARLIHWGVCLLALRASHSFTPETARVTLLLARETADYISGCAREGEARSGAALAVAGELFSEFSASGEWREVGRRLLDEAAASKVLPDGGDASLSLYVHERTLDAFVAGALSGGDASPARGAAGRMLAFERAILMPGGELPGVSDRRAAGERLARLDLAASLLGIAEERAPGPEFHAFEQSGFYVMRTGRDPEADCLLVRPAGAWGLRMACSGREVLAGPASPVAARHKEDARPCTQLDVCAADTSSSAPARAETEGPRSVEYRAGPPCDYVRVVSGLGGHGGPPAATHRREVLFFERRWWVLADRVRSEVDAEWTLELVLGEPPEDASPDGRRFVSGDLLVSLAGPTDSGFRFESDERGHTVARAVAAGRDVSFVTLLYPLGDEEPGEVSVEPVATADGRAAGLAVSVGGAEGLVAFPHGERVELDAVPPGEQAIALSRSGGAWRTVFTAR